MHIPSSPHRILSQNFSRLLLLTLVAAAFRASPSAEAADLSASYAWNPVSIGAGGFVTGFVSHPADSAIRYCRTDVGNAYRWDSSAGRWRPMEVRIGSQGLPASVMTAPGSSGCESIAVDPNNTNVVLMAFPINHSADVTSTFPNIPGTVYRSADGGLTFAKSDLAISMSPNGGTRTLGERLAVDPDNGQNVFYGSVSTGLYVSANGGLHWSAVSGNGAPSSTANVIGVRFDANGSGPSIVYAVVSGGSIYKSTNGGVNWTNMTSGSGLDTHPGNSWMCANGDFFIMQSGSDYVWKLTRSGTLARLNIVNFGWGQNANGVTVDPNNTSRIFVVGEGGALSRSLDGGSSWTPLGHNLVFANSFGWLPQVVNGSNQMWRSNGGIYFDCNSTLWIPEGNEGMLTCTPSAGNTETASNPPQWTIQSAGIEEFVTHDVKFLPGTGDQAVVAVEDASAFHISGAGQFTATQATLQNQLISNGTSIAYSQNAPLYVACATADANNTGSGANYSGYSIDGGVTWKPFASRPSSLRCGTIAVSRRGSGWGEGSDHLVFYPANNHPPYYSHDGGATWTVTTSFPQNSDGSINGNTGEGYWTFSLKQREMIGDPFVVDRFYLNLVVGGTWRSDDGGVTWTKLSGNGLPNWAHHGQMAANPFVQGDVWFCDGWEGASSHGLYHSTNSAASFQKISGISYAITLAVGKGHGAAGDAAYTVYFYGLMSGDNNWGIFRSINGGSSWDRISGFPTGVFDVPTSMDASQESFGKVMVGFGGQSFVYGIDTTMAKRYEAESLPVAASAPGNRVISDPGFSAGSASILDSTATGNYITYTVPGVSAGSYNVRIGSKNFNSRGIWQLAIGPAGSNTPVNLGAPADEYSAGTDFATFDLGTWRPASTSDKWFKFTIAGKNAASAGYTECIDFIELIPQ